MSAWLRLLRVKHYIKNLLVFFPLFLVGGMTDARLFWKVSAGFAVFSLFASSVYVINDIRDAEADRLHPTKRGRPIASGEISVAGGVVAVLGMMAAALAVALLAGNVIEMMFIPVLYLFINILYSMGLKNYPLVDVFILMLGYLLRLLYGGRIAGCGVSTWLFLTMMAAAFFMGFGKRRGELKKYGDGSRKNLGIYTEAFLDQGMIISCTLAVMFYAMACTDESTVVVSKGTDLLWSVPGIVIILFRYLMLVLGGENDGDPVSVILSDKFLLCTAGGFAVILGWILYVK